MNSKLPEILEGKLDIKKIMEWYDEWYELDKTPSYSIEAAANEYLLIANKYSQSGYYREGNVILPQLTSQFLGIVRFVGSEADSSGVSTGFFVEPNILVTAHHNITYYENEFPHTWGAMIKNRGFVTLSNSDITKRSDLELAIIELEDSMQSQILELSEETPRFQPIVAVGYTDRIPYHKSIMASFGALLDYEYTALGATPIASLPSKSNYEQNLMKQCIFGTAPSEAGYSGSPIFSLSGSVIGMHIGRILTVNQSILGIPPTQIVMPAHKISQALKDYKALTY